MFGSVLLGLIASIGTGIQAVQALADIRKQDEGVFKAYEAVEALRTEFKPWRNPFKWFGQRRILRGLLDRESVEYKAWWSVHLKLISWAMLLAAASLGTVDAALATGARLFG